MINTAVSRFSNLAVFREESLEKDKCEKKKTFKAI